MLGKRLLKIASFVDKNVIMADIGSDHAYLPIYLVKEGLIQKAYAMEVAEGPLNQSQKAIKSAKLEEKIYTILSNGLVKIPSDVKEVVIAGMGGLTIIEILRASFDKLKNYQKIIIQANSHMCELRCFLSESAFTIIDEAIIKETNKYYEILVFKAEKGHSLSEIELKYGPILIREKSATFIEYYTYLLSNNRQILADMPQNSNNYQLIMQKIAELEAILNIKQ